MKLNNSNIFDDNNDISLDEYDIDSLVDKNMKRLGKNFYRLPELRKAIENPVLDVEKLGKNHTSK